MDEALLKQIVRQLKFLNFWITFFGCTIIIGFIIGGIALYSVITAANNSVKKLENFQQQTSKNLDIKSQLCSNDSLTTLLGSQSSICK
ncbi:MAG: hypothetical protein QFB87_00425 [Patescibacteria group bacterium]|nr:hypothetical protein [Patescibacteria group bacterium]